MLHCWRVLNSSHQVYDYGVLTLSDAASDALMVISVAAVGFLSCWLSNRYKLDASMRLFVITFLIVSPAPVVLLLRLGAGKGNAVVPSAGVAVLWHQGCQYGCLGHPACQGMTPGDNLRHRRQLVRIWLAHVLGVNKMYYKMYSKV